MHASLGQNMCMQIAVIGKALPGVLLAKGHVSPSFSQCIRPGYAFCRCGRVQVQPVQCSCDVLMISFERSKSPHVTDIDIQQLRGGLTFRKCFWQATGYPGSTGGLSSAAAPEQMGGKHLAACRSLCHLPRRAHSACSTRTR